MKTEIEKMDEYFRVLNYLTVAQIYLLDNPLLRRPLVKEDVKKKLIGHWGSAPGQNFIYVHLNRVINKYDLDMFYISGPGHAGNAQIAAAYVEGTYSEIYPEYTHDEKGLQKLFKHFSFPGGVGSHATPEVPGSINEGGELGYSLSHAFGAVLDKPNLIAACVVGDGEAETGPLAGSWHANKLLNPLTDGVVLPILHLNGYKIANPTVLDRITHEELIRYFEGMGYKPYFVDGVEPMKLHEETAKIMDDIILDIQNIKTRAKLTGDTSRPLWPMLILRTPKGWTGLKKYQDKDIEGTFRAHQVPIPNVDTEENLKLLEDWFKSYNIDELFDEKGEVLPYIKELAPKGDKRMSANPICNAGIEPLVIPDHTPFGLKFEQPGSIDAGDMGVLGGYVAEVVDQNENFRIFGPDEALSNKFNKVFEKTTRQFNGIIHDWDEFQGPQGKVIDTILSEHLCQGMLEGYNLTGRHGLFHSYEAFIRIVDSMASQHAKWMKMSNDLDWRKDIPSFNYILTSHCWQQDHNGYTHQNPGFLNHIITKKADTIRIYLPYDANSLLCTFNHILNTHNRINVIVASKHDRPQWLSIEDAKKHFAKGVGIFNWASDDNPDIVLGCAGDTPTLEVLAATQFLNDNIPELKIRVVNVVDLMKLQPNDRHPHGLTNDEYNEIFTKDKPIIFAFHGYPDLIHQLTYKRENRDIHVRGYIEEGTITTPFDMRVVNKMDRYTIALDVLKYVKVDHKKQQSLKDKCNDILKRHYQYIRDEGVDLPEVVNFKWRGRK